MPRTCWLVPVFVNSELLREYSFDEVRERAELPLVKLRQQEKVRGQGVWLLGLVGKEWSDPLYNYSRHFLHGL